MHAQKGRAGNWEYSRQDGLGSVRGIADPTGAMVWSTNYVPFGGMFGAAGTAHTSYGFTGEQYSATDLVYLRARHYNPALGIFAGLDPFEGLRQRPMSLNGYSWVEGNLPNDTDPSGRFGILALAGLLFIGALSVAVLQPIINNALCAAGSPYCLRDGDSLRNLNNMCANIRDNVSNVAQRVGRLFGSGSVSNAQFLGVPSQGIVSSGGITTVTPTLEVEYIPTAPRFPTIGGSPTVTPTPDFEYVPTTTPFQTPVPYPVLTPDFRMLLDISSQLEDAARAFGLDDVQTAAFAAGNVVLYTRPTEGGAPLIGYLQNVPPRLRSAILSINDTSGGATAEFARWRASTRTLARSIGASEYELIGAIPVNTRIADMLRRLGFEATTEILPEDISAALGAPPGTRDEIDILRKVFPVTGD